MIDSMPLLLMACSATKLDRPAPARDLYRGVMYETFRAHVKEDAQPNRVILSALHGFVCPDTVLSPYEHRMTADRADEMLADLPRYMAAVTWPTDTRKVFLAGGMQYRRVMRAAIERLSGRGRIAAEIVVGETQGAIGVQRSQLGNYLRSLHAPWPRIVGHHQNGTPLVGSAGGFEVGQKVVVAYRARPDLAPQHAVIRELFDGPSGLTASVALESLGAAGTPGGRWVDLQDLLPA